MHHVTKTGFRVLDTLSRNLGRDLPISTLSDEISSRFGTGHYKNVHEAATQLGDAGYLKIEKTGGTSLVSLDLTRVQTVDLLAEIDLRSRREDRTGPLASPTPTSQIQALLHTDPSVGTAFLADASINRTLNRLEVIIAARGDIPRWPVSDDSSTGPSPQGGLLDLHERLNKEARKANVRVDALLLTEGEFKHALSRTELNPVQAQAKRRTALVDPQRFWWLIHEAHVQGPKPRMRTSWAPTKAPIDLVSPMRDDAETFGQHLERFGYSEMGQSGEPPLPACLELVVAAALGSQEPRRRYASAVLLAKNEANPRLLAFLANKHGLTPDLLGMIEALGDHPRSPKLQEVLLFLPEDIEPADIDQDRVEELLDLYGARS